jgi:hypothetical protein
MSYHLELGSEGHSFNGKAIVVNSKTGEHLTSKPVNMARASAQLMVEERFDEAEKKSYTYNFHYLDSAKVKRPGHPDDTVSGLKGCADVFFKQIGTDISDISDRMRNKICRYILKKLFPTASEFEGDTLTALTEPNMEGGDKQMTQKGVKVKTKSGIFTDYSTDKLKTNTLKAIKKYRTAITKSLTDETDSDVPDESEESEVSLDELEDERPAGGAGRLAIKNK